MSLLKNNDATSVPGALCSDSRVAPVASEEVTQAEGSNDYARLLDQYGSAGRSTEGEVVKGKVLKVTAAEVVIDVGCKSEGIIPLQEFIDSAGSLKVKAGDEIEVFLESAEDQEGHIVLSREKAERVKAWDDIERAFDNQVI